jgi:purine-binding chemotaxis protein CheW
VHYFYHSRGEELHSELTPRSASSLTSGAAQMGGEYLAFRLGEEAYGVNILGIQEIRFYEQPTRVAGSPPHVRGILNLRGVSVPVLDLRVCFGLDAHFDASTVTVVITPSGEQVVGLIVDSVSDVVALEDAQLRSMPTLSESNDASYIQGLGSIQQEGVERTLLLLDIPQLMNHVQCGVTTKTN